METAFYINQESRGSGFYIAWITCLDCGWQSMAIGITKKEAINRAIENGCFLCGSRDIKLRNEDEEFFNNQSERLLKDKNSNVENFAERMLYLKTKNYCKKVSNILSKEE